MAPSPATTTIYLSGTLVTSPAANRKTPIWVTPFKRVYTQQSRLWYGFCKRLLSHCSKLGIEKLQMNAQKTKSYHISAAAFQRGRVCSIRRWSDKGALKFYRVGSSGDRRYRCEDILPYRVGRSATGRRTDPSWRCAYIRPQLGVSELSFTLIWHLRILLTSACRRSHVTVHAHSICTVNGQIEDARE